jgi:hypothetical protein
MIPDHDYHLAAPCFKLTNAEVKLALAGYHSSREEIVRYLLAENAFSDQDGKPSDKPFGFDLGPLKNLRKVVTEALRSRDRNGRRQSKLGGFQRELVHATADAARGDRDALVLHLYLALMEREMAAPDHDDDAEASDAGQYLLRCLAVQAVYDNLRTYQLVLEQFARVVGAIKITPAAAYTRMLGPLLAYSARRIHGFEKKLPCYAPPASATRPPGQMHLVAIVDLIGNVTDDHDGDALLASARALGEKLGTRCVLLVQIDPAKETRSAAYHAMQGALGANNAATRAPGRVICSAGKGNDWRVARQIFIAGDELAIRDASFTIKLRPRPAPPAAPEQGTTLGEEFGNLDLSIVGPGQQAALKLSDLEKEADQSVPAPLVATSAGTAVANALALFLARD